MIPLPLPQIIGIPPIPKSFVKLYNRSGRDVVFVGPGATGCELFHTNTLGGAQKCVVRQRLTLKMYYTAGHFRGSFSWFLSGPSRSVTWLCRATICRNCKTSYIVPSSPQSQLANGNQVQHSSKHGSNQENITRRVWGGLFVMLSWLLLYLLLCSRLG